MGEEGIYHDGTRFLSRLRLLVNDRRPLLLSSTVREDNLLLTVDLTNPDHRVDGELLLPRDTVHVFRSSFLYEGVCYTRVRVHNFALRTITLTLSLLYAADFVDIFEVRGMRRDRRGEALPPHVDERAITLGYRGLDEVERRTQIAFDPSPNELTASAARFELALPPQGDVVVEATITCDWRQGRSAADFEQASTRSLDDVQSLHALDATIVTSNESFNDWINRSAADLHMMITRTPHGPYPYAGVPWFSTFFGRDGIITAIEYLWINPEIARGVLSFLASTQATELKPEQDAEPGKIVHEIRRGEMAALGEIPFGQYYGTVDATPLFVMLASAYYRRTGDRSFIQSLWPHIVRALAWIEHFADSDGDGFCDYFRAVANRLGYAGLERFRRFRISRRRFSRRGAGCPLRSTRLCLRRLASRRRSGITPRFARARRRLHHRADVLQQRFEAAFWCEDMSTYALALDREKQPCRVPRIKCGSLPFHRDCALATCQSRRADALGRHVVLRIWHSHSGHDRGALQPDVVSQWLHLATRQRADCVRLGALWIAARSRKNPHRNVRCQYVDGPPPYARAILWVCRVVRAKAPRFIRSPVRRRPGLPAPCFCSCKPVSV